MGLVEGFAGGGEVAAGQVKAGEAQVGIALKEAHARAKHRCQAFMGRI